MNYLFGRTHRLSGWMALVACLGVLGFAIGSVVGNSLSGMRSAKAETRPCEHQICIAMDCVMDDYGDTTCETVNECQHGGGMRFDCNGINGMWCQDAACCSLVGELLNVILPPGIACPPPAW